MILGIGVITLSAVIVALPLSGSTLWNEAFSAYDFTLDVVFLFQKWFVYEVMLRISLKWWHILKRIIQQCLQFVYFVYFKSGSSIERVSYLILIRMGFIVWLLYFLSCVTLSSYLPTLSLCFYLVSIQLK